MALLEALSQFEARSTTQIFAQGIYGGKTGVGYGQVEDVYYAAPIAVWARASFGDLNTFAFHRTVSSQQMLQTNTGTVEHHPKVSWGDIEQLANLFDG